MSPTTLTEQIADWHTRISVDRTRRTVRNIALTGGVSKNGYRYTEQALRNAAALYEHKPVFLDHAGDRSRPQERSTRDLVGTIVRPRFESGRIRGDVRVLDTDSGRTFLALAESNAPGVGMSHVVLAERAATDGTIERIQDVVSVDAVVFPATTKSFHESTDTVSTPTEVVGADEASITEQQQLRQRVQQLLSERDSLREQLQTLRDRDAEESAQRQLQQELDASGLPASALTELFLEQLRQADESGRAALIVERRNLIAAARRQPPLSVERPSRHEAASTDALFLSVIKRQVW